MVEIPDSGIHASMSQQVALLRERHLSNSEVINYRSISNYDIVAIGSKGRNQEVDVPVRSLYSSASITQPVLDDAARAVQSLILGSSTYMYGLVDEMSGFDIIHSIETFQGFSEQAIEAKRKHGCRIVCTVFENIPYFAESDHYSRTWREALKHRDADSIKHRVREETDAFVAMSDRAKTALEIEGVEADRIHVVPMGVDVTQFQPGYSRSGLPGQLGDKEILNVVFVGRHTWEKGIFDLLSAWKQLCEKTDMNISLSLIGSGPDTKQIRRYVTHANIPHIDVCERVSYENMPAVYDAADLTVVPSLPTRFWQEQYGRVIVESQACATPVIASETGGIPYAMGGHGVLAQPGDPHDWYQKIRSLLEDSDRRERIGRESRDHVVENRTIEQFGKRVEDIYDSVM